LTTGRRPVVKIIAKSLPQHDEKYAVPAPFSGIRVCYEIKENEIITIKVLSCYSNLILSFDN
jgi:hypothetical protein